MVTYFETVSDLYTGLRQLAKLYDTTPNHRFALSFVRLGDKNECAARIAYNGRHRQNKAAAL